MTASSPDSPHPSAPHRSAPHPSAKPGTLTQIQRGARLIGVVFALIGLLGFVPGLTQPYAELTFATTSSKALLLGIFQVSVLLNLVHLAFGAAGILMSRSALQARAFLFWGGIVYAVFFFYGILVPQPSAGNVVPFNAPDNALHIGLAVVMVTLSIVLNRGRGWRRKIESGDVQI